MSNNGKTSNVGDKVSKNNYELVFYGELKTGADLQTTKTLVGELFKANASQIARMFSGNRIVIKNKLDKVTAEKYQTAILKRGAKTLIETMQSSAAPSSEQSVAAPPIAPSASASQTPKVETPHTLQNAITATSQNYSDLPKAEVNDASADEITAFQQKSRQEGQEDATESHSTRPALKTLNTTPLKTEEQAQPRKPRAPGIHLAGDAVDSILADKHFDVAPVGTQLADGKAEANGPTLTLQETLNLAPVGTKLTDKKDEPTPSIPDVSHLHISE
jgi:hypothetical protein